MALAASPRRVHFWRICRSAPAVGAGGGTRTHTTLPSRDFKSLASTSSATSAPLFLIGFLPRGNECFPGQRSRFPKRCKTCSLCVPHPSEGPDDVRLRLDVPGVVLAHALRLVAQQGRPPPSCWRRRSASTTRHRRRARYRGLGPSALIPGAAVPVAIDEYRLRLFDTGADVVSVDYVRRVDPHRASGERHHVSRYRSRHVSGQNHSR